VSAGRREPSGSSTGSTRARALALIRRILEGFDRHPYFFVIRVSGSATPPVEPYAHQVELLFRVAFRRPVRILVGDEIGLGKTVEAILAARMLVERGHASRVLILVPRILVKQWISELLRFGVRAVELTRSNIEAKARDGFPDRWYVASIDFAKRDRYRELIAGGSWDIVIVDEAHRVGLVGRKREKNQRYIFVEELARTVGRSVIMLSATPHRGFADDYIARLKLLDPYLTASKELDSLDFYRLTMGSIVFRRGKQDVNEVYEQREIFKKARLVARVVIASEDEIRFDRELISFLREKLLDYYEMVGEEPRALPLLLALIVKRASSSPYAALKTLERILERRGSTPSQSDLDSKAASIAEKYLGIGFEEYGEDDEGQEPDEAVNEFAQGCSALLSDRDVERLRRIYELAGRIAGERDSRLASAISIINEHLGRGEKVVLFTEYRDTAHYIYEWISKKHPNIARGAVLITSREVIAPGRGGHRGLDIEDVKRMLASGEVRLVISTDVASEGLNLQVANILIHYEPLWSPVKVEQRLGRVWRLGQESDVTAYTIFLSRESDKDILEVIYKKLVALGRSLSTSRSTVGEEVVIDMGGEGHASIPVEPGPGSGERYSEYRAIIKYIAGGREALERYVNSIVNTLKALKEQLSRIGLSAAASKENVDSMFRDVGGFRGVDGYIALKEIFKASAMLAGFNVDERDNAVYAGGYVAKSHSDLYSYAKHIAETCGDTHDNRVYMVSSYQCGVRELHLYMVSVAVDWERVYSESVGVAIYDSGDRRVVRGAELLKLVAASLSPEHLVSAADEYEPPEAIKYLGELAKQGAIDAVRRATSGIIGYIDKTEGLGLASRHEEWVPRGIEQYQPTSIYLGSIVYAGGRGGVEGAPPPAHVKEVEEAAMRAAMEYERRRGRIPEDVSMREHYDILSRDPGTGEARYIEVKGRSGFDLEVELTEEEFKLARELGERYWLYIVYGIGSGSPRILAIRDPARSIEWREEIARRYRARLGV
jgi:superfamily II DNA or RNA helicase